MKVIDKIKEAIAGGVDRAVFSFEFFPPSTGEGLENLFERMERMVVHNPAFCDITWGAGGSKADMTLKVADKMQNVVGVETMVHLTCRDMPLEKIYHSLTTIKSLGIQNVLALRGDPPRQPQADKFIQGRRGFDCALDLVKHIRSQFGDYFGIAVAGYPEAHPDVPRRSNGLATIEGYHNDLVYLKRKVDAGADLIVTQLFYDTDTFLRFVNDCRQIGITCPIVPGIMPINSYEQFSRFTRTCKIKVPVEIKAILDPIQDDEKAVRAYGVHLGTEMCKKIMAFGIKTLHLYTLNKENSALAILMNLGLINEMKISRSFLRRDFDTGMYLPEDRTTETALRREKRTCAPSKYLNDYVAKFERFRRWVSKTNIGWEQFAHEGWCGYNNISYGALTDYQLQEVATRNYTRPAGSISKSRSKHTFGAKFGPN